MGNNIKVTSYCAPEVSLENVLKGENGWKDHNNVAVVNLCWKEGDDVSQGLQGVVFKTLKFVSTIRQPMYIGDCPFDEQQFNLEFQLPKSASRNSKDHNRYLVPLNASIQFDTRGEMWNYHRMVVHTTKPIGETQTMICAVRASRNSSNIVIRLMTPVLM